MSKFLSYEKRLIIAHSQQENASFGKIAKKIGKDRTTIAKEIKKYSYDKKSGRPGYPYTPENSVFYVRQRGSVVMPAAISQPINVASVRNAPCIVPTLR